MQVAPGKHLAEQMADLTLQQTVGGQHFPAVQTKRLAVETAHRAARFRHQQSPRRRVPRIQVELPEAVEPSAGGVGKVERRRTRAPDACERSVNSW